MIDIATLISTAISLHDMERDLDRWGIEISHLTEVIPSASARSFERICRDTAILHIQMDSGFRIHCDEGQRIRERVTEGMDQERLAIDTEQKAKSAENGARLLDLRSRLRSLDRLIGDAVSALRTLDVDTVILRSMPKDGAPIPRAAVEALVKAHHDAVGDAQAAWRTMYENRPILIITGHTTRAEIDASLRRLADAGSLRHNRRLRGGGDWSLAPDALPKAA